MQKDNSNELEDFEKMLNDALIDSGENGEKEQEEQFDRNKKYWVQAECPEEKKKGEGTSVKKNKSKNKKENKNNAKSDPQKPKVKVGTVIKTAFFTVFCFLCSFCFLIVCLTPIIPNTILQAFNYVGAKSASYLVYKRVYERHKTNENLYNVIQLAIERKNYEDMEQYIEIMVQGDKFSNFAKKVDEKTKVALGELYSVYANSYESYLRGNWVLALYKNNNKLSAKMLAIDSVEGTVTELYVYVNCIKNDQNLTELQKEAELKTLQTRYNMVEMLKVKLDSLQDEYSMATTPSAKLIAINQRVLILDIIITIGTNTLKEEELGEFKRAKEELTVEADAIKTELFG